MTRRYYLCRQCKSKFAFSHDHEEIHLNCKHCSAPLNDVTQIYKKTLQQKLTQKFQAESQKEQVDSETVALKTPTQNFFLADSSLIARGCDTQFIMRPSLLKHLIEDLRITCKINLDSFSETPEKAKNKKYVRLEKIGQGATCHVYKARDEDFQRYVAMKIFIESEQLAGDALERFLEEAQITSQLQHPNIVPIHDLGIDEIGRIFFTMKWVQGETLATHLSKRSEKKFEKKSESLKKNKTLPQKTPEDVKQNILSLLHLFLKICDGIAYAHSRHVIHRDLKPENIMVGEFGETLIMDWGIAYVLGREDKHFKDLKLAISQIQNNETSSRRTLVGSVFGTLSYMPPEQARGDLEHVDVRSDVFSLGAILYEILTETPPYKPKSVIEMLIQASKAEIEAPEKRTKAFVPAELSAICMKALSAKPAFRYQQVQHLSEDIRRYLEGRSVSAKSDNIVEKTIKWTKRHKAATTSMITAFVFVLLFFFSYAWNQKIQEKLLQERLIQLESIYQQSFEKNAERLRLLEQYATLYFQNTQKNITEAEEALRLKLIEANAAHTVLSIQIQERIRFIKKEFIAFPLSQKKCISLETLLKKDELTYQTYSLLFQEKQQVSIAYLQQKTDLPLQLEKLYEEVQAFESHSPEYNAETKTLLNQLKPLGFIQLKMRGKTEAVRLFSFEPDPNGLLQKKPVSSFQFVESQSLLAPASYLLEINVSAQKEPIVYPFFLLRGETQLLTIETFPFQQISLPGMQFVPRGKFFQGGEAGESLRYHRSEVSSFFMDQREVTYQDFLPYVQERVRQGVPLNNISPQSLVLRNNAPAILQEGNRFFIHQAQPPKMPLIYITWKDAKEYCVWKNELAKQTGLSQYGFFDLPTEAEWEYAARGADGRAFVWGNEFKRSYANVAKVRSPAFTAEVGSFEKDCSLFKIYDLAGNIREWTITPFKKGDETFILKGGDFEAYEEHVRHANRYVDSPYHSYYRTGFRCVFRLFPEKQ